MAHLLKWTFRGGGVKMRRLFLEDLKGRNSTIGPVSVGLPSRGLGSFISESEYHHIADKFLQEMFDHLGRIEDEYDLEITLSVSLLMSTSTVCRRFSAD